MAIKRNVNKNIKTLDCFHKFEIKKVGGDTFIQGWANKAVVDRGQDIIHMDAWSLDNYKKVPTILFNHDKDKPIGKAVDVRPTDQGLWIKAKISNSKDPTISMVRDLINEGMLNAFSVGFDSKDEQRNNDGINEIKSAELYECSVVTLPMNQDSVFDVSTKSLMSMTRPQAISTILKAKGAWVAEAVHGKMSDMEKSGTQRDELLSQISSHAGISQDDLTQVMAGNVTPVPEKVLDAFATVLGLGIRALKKLDAGDVEQTQKGQDEMDQEKPQDEPMEKDGDESEEAPNKVAIIGIAVPKDQAQSADDAQTMVSDAGYSPTDVSDQGDSWYVMLEDPADFEEGTSMLDLGNSITAVVGLRKPLDSQPPEDQEPPMPADEATPPADAQAEGKGPPPPPAAEEDPKKKPPMPPHPSQGHKKPVVEGGTPPSNAWTDYGKPKPDASEPPAEEGKGPPPPKADANPPAGQGQPPQADQPPAQGDQQAPPPSDGEEDPAKVKEEYQQFQQDEAATVDGKPGNPASWVADEALWEKAKAASQAAVGKIDYAFVVWWYLQHGGTKKSESQGRQKKVKDGNTAPISGGGDATIPIDDNPYLAQARQTNVLLGVLIKHVQELCASMQGGAIGQGQMGAAPKDEKGSEPMQTYEEQDELEKMLKDNLQKYAVALDEKLKKIGA